VTLTPHTLPDDLEVETHPVELFNAGLSNFVPFTSADESAGGQRLVAAGAG